MPPNQNLKKQLSVLGFKDLLSAQIAKFAENPDVFKELSSNRHVSGAGCNLHLNYYGRRKHWSQYRAERAAKEAAREVPAWNSGPIQAALPLVARIGVEQASHSNHRMHAQLRRSIVSVLNYLVQKCDLVTGVCVSLTKKSAREIYVGEIAASVGLGKRTVQRALSALARHKLIRRGVALIGLAPELYKATGLYSAVRVLVGSLKTLQQRKGFRGRIIDPAQIQYHKNFHRFRSSGAFIPSVRKLLASLEIIPKQAVSPPPAQKVPAWNSCKKASLLPPSNAPPPVADPAPASRTKEVGSNAIAGIKKALNKLP